MTNDPTIGNASDEGAQVPPVDEKLCASCGAPAGVLDGGWIYAEVRLCKRCFHRLQELLKARPRRQKR